MAEKNISTFMQSAWDSMAGSQNLGNLWPAFTLPEAQGIYIESNSVDVRILDEPIM
jgi:hypothetical protein